MRFIRLDYVLLRSLATLVVVLAVTLSSWWPEATVSSAAEMPVGATLKVLAVPVEVLPAQTETFVAATDGQMLNQGDVVRTGPGGLALLTFFDGSESQLGAETRVQIERAEANPAPQIALLQTAGVTMNHVVPMPPGGSFQTDTPAATGLVRGTSYVVVVGEGASQSADQRTCGQNGDRSCATSVILLTDRDGHVGRVDVAAPGSTAAAIHLARAGDAAASDAGHTAAAHLAQPYLQALEAGANARELPDTAQDAEHHAHVVAAALARLTAPLADKSIENAETRDALEPAPAKSKDEQVDRFEETGRILHPHLHADEPHPVAPVSATGTAVARTGSDDNNHGSGQTSPVAAPPTTPLAAQPTTPLAASPTAPLAAPPAAAPPAAAPPAALPVTRAVPAPPVSVPAPSASNPQSGTKGETADPPDKSGNS